MFPIATYLNDKINVPLISAKRFSWTGNYAMAIPQKRTPPIRVVSYQDLSTGLT